MRVKATIWCCIISMLCTYNALSNEIQDFNATAERNGRSTDLPALDDDYYVPGAKDVLLPPVDLATATTVTPTQTQSMLNQNNGLFVIGILLEGNTAFTDEQLAHLIDPYELRFVTFNEIYELSQTLTRFYINQGYNTSGVWIPEQTAQLGLVRLNVTEGVLSDIQLVGKTKLRDQYITDRVYSHLNGPLNIAQLQESLLLLEQNARIQQVQAQLLPSEQRGGSILQLDVIENPPYQFGVTTNNHISPSVGAERLLGTVSHNNLTGFGDSLTLGLGRTKGLDDFFVNYSRPINQWDTTVNVSFSKTRSTVIEAPFDDLDIKSVSENIQLTVRHPFITSLSRSFIGELTLNKRKTQSFLLGDEFAFSQGAQEGESRVTAIRASVSWTQRQKDRVLSARGTLSAGLKALNATENESGPDGQFVSLLGQAQYVQRLNQGQFISRFSFQLAKDPLLSLEQFSLGGSNSVRGYRENDVVRDNAISVSVEYRHPLFVDEETGISRYGLSLAPFMDFGYGWNTAKQGVDRNGERIYSVGVGLLYNPRDAMNIGVYYGIDLAKTDSTRSNIQDKGIHISINMDWSL